MLTVRIALPSQQMREYRFDKEYMLQMVQLEEKHAQALKDIINGPLASIDAVALGHS